MFVAEPLLHAWMHSGELNQMLGVLADQSYRGHYVRPEDLEKIKEHVAAAEKLTAQCLRRDSVSRQCGEAGSAGNTEMIQ